MFKAFGKEPMLTMGLDHLECDWETTWREVRGIGG